MTSLPSLYSAFDRLTHPLPVLVVWAAASDTLAYFRLLSVTHNDVTMTSGINMTEMGTSFQGCLIWYPNWVRLVPKWDNSGTFKEYFQYILARRAKMY